MKPFFRLTWSTLKRALLSKSFSAAVLGLAAMSLLSVWDEVSNLEGNPSSVTYLYQIAEVAKFWVLYLLFAAIPGAALFCADWENRYIRFSVARCSKRVYGWALACACFLSAVLTVFAGEWLFLLILRLRWPFAGENMLGLEYGCFSSYAEENRVWIYFMVKILIKGFFAGFCSTFALWLSTRITNVFVALTTPIILYYVLENLTVLLRLPSALQIGKLLKVHVEIGGRPLLTLLYPVLLFSAMSLLFSALFTRGEKRRLENG